MTCESLGTYKLSPRLNSTIDEWKTFMAICYIRGKSIKYHNKKINEQNRYTKYSQTGTQQEQFFKPLKAIKQDGI
jgi:hypothetical protein